ncbi:hypothetical protein TWF694_005451 [Orbilia ellipsospora]|uniref:Uncharacterized protein n=1 Tax=Orbilia ellipsospora TaxID=2528407 RepID=A0AAV9WT50_9PEZI
MKFSTVCTALLSLTLANARVISRQTDEKFQATNYGAYDGKISGEIETPEGCENVQVFWAAGDAWQKTPIPTESRWFNKFRHVSYWAFSSPAPGATQFYLKATCAGKDIYAPGNFVNYQLNH